MTATNEGVKTATAPKGRVPKKPAVKKPPAKKADASLDKTIVPKRGRGRPRKIPLAVVQDTKVVESGPEPMGESLKEGEAEGAPEETKLKRQIKKSRIILELEEYQKDITHANELIYARRKLRQAWKDFETKNPPSYVSHPNLRCC